MHISLVVSRASSCNWIDVKENHSEWREQQCMDKVKINEQKKSIATGPLYVPAHRIWNDLNIPTCGGLKSHGISDLVTSAACLYLVTHIHAQADPSQKDSIGYVQASNK